MPFATAGAGAGAGAGALFQALYIFIHTYTLYIHVKVSFFAEYNLRRKDKTASSQVEEKSRISLSRLTFDNSPASKVLKTLIQRNNNK